MPEPIGAFSPEAVIEAIEDNLVGASASLGRTEDGVVFRGRDVTWVYTGYPTLSRVLRARFTEEQAEDRVAQICECFRGWDAPVSWVVGPTSWPPQLRELLRDSGFDAGEVWTGLARDLTGDDPVAPPLPPAFAVTPATTTADLDAWAALDQNLVAREPAADGENTAAPTLFSPDNAGGAPRCRYYLATLDGKPVARGMAYASGDVVGLHLFTAAPGHRGKGYELAVACRVLSDARAAGGRMAVMHARGELQQLGQQLGFHPYCQFSVHAWPPVAPSHA